MHCDIRNLGESERRTAENILRAVENKTNSHSYILEGGSSHSRLRCAYIIACAAICSCKNGLFPCFECTDCKKILCGEHTDIKTISPESAGKEIKVDDIRTVRREAYVMPTECDYHIYIIADSDRMNKNAQNALLKIFEEPPENTIFLLLTPSKELLLPTVISRAQIHSLGRQTVNEAKASLKESFPKLSDTSISRAARIVGVFEKTEVSEATINCIDSAYDIAKDYFINKNKRITDRLPKGQADLALTLSLLALGARDIAVSKKNENSKVFLFDCGNELEKAKSGCTVKRALELYDAFSKASDRIKAYGNVNTTLAELFTCIRK